MIGDVVVPSFDVGLLKLQAEFLTDLEKVRIANGNRVFALQDRYGLVAGDPELVKALKLGAALKVAEKMAEDDLTAALKVLPIFPWVKGTVGLGSKQVGRLLGTIGHPCWRSEDSGEVGEDGERLVRLVPRSIGQLWSYCGYGVWDGVAPHRRAGVQSTWNAEARTRTFLIAESCIKQRSSPYRSVYDAGRVKYAEAVHSVPCARCSPKGKPPAVPGSPLSDGHKHMRAMRLVAKEILRDLWLAAAG